MTAAAKTKGRVDLDRTRSRLDQLGLGHASEALSDLIQTAAKENQPAHLFLDQLLESELSQREERRVTTSLKLSGLPTGHTLGGFDWNFQPGIQKSQIDTLATCEWIRQHDTLLIQGPPGVGKTHLAISLGVKAVENGFSVNFLRLDDLLHQMKRDADLAPQRLKRKKYMNVALLVVDEVGFQPMTRQEASLF
ncbi:ATP-binding protein, partial [bacterium]|nr:ATP-binding protein [bacterium]